MAQTVDTSPDQSRDTTLAAETWPATETLLAPGTVPPSALDLPAGFAFAPAPTVPANQTVPAERTIPADRPAPLARPLRRFHLGWYEAAVIALVLSSGGVCLYRLLWAIQP